MPLDASGGLRSRRSNRALPATACALIGRDPVTSVIVRVSNVLVNIDDTKLGASRIEGVDVYNDTVKAVL